MLDQLIAGGEERGATERKVLLDLHPEQTTSPQRQRQLVCRRGSVLPGHLGPESGRFSRLVRSRRDPRLGWE